MADNDFEGFYSFAFNELRYTPELTRVLTFQLPWVDFSVLNVTAFIVVGDEQVSVGLGEGIWRCYFFFNLLQV